VSHPPRLASWCRAIPPILELSAGVMLWLGGLSAHGEDRGATYRRGDQRWSSFSGKGWAAVPFGFGNAL
ncbi:MAG: hypothetical protein LC739_10615, partial [Actinobacteria bacterium]|nr:hypothetical protein [Actinomycetota bacterium]